MFILLNFYLLFFVHLFQNSFTLRVHLRHLELEPLCSLSSCVVRSGCVAIIVADITFITITTVLILFLLYDNCKFTLWRDVQPTFYSLVSHPMFMYILLAYNVVSSTNSSILKNYFHTVIL